MGEKALLVVGDQVDPEASHKLLICSDEVRRLIDRTRTQTTLNDLVGDLQRWVVIHDITEAIESILEKRLIGRDPLESFESCSIWIKEIPSCQLISGIVRDSEK